MGLAHAYGDWTADILDSVRGLTARMWSIANTTPYSADANILRDIDGAETLVVIVKGTFSFDENGRCELADEQVAIAGAPQFRGAPQVSSMLWDTDFVPTKPTTDVLLHGHAYSVKGTTAAKTDVSLRVGRIHRKLRVFGDRVLERGLSGLRPSAPEPFQRIPIVYERAFGGTSGAVTHDGMVRCDLANPVGIGFGRPGTGDPVPNLETVDGEGGLAGFGPIARHWSPRVKLAGTYDDTWRRDRFPLLPRDFQERFYQSAPIAQQAPTFLTGGEPVELLGLTQSGEVRFVLPRVFLVFNSRIASDLIVHHARLHTILFQSDHGLVTMTWHTSVRCHGRTRKISRIHIREKPYLTRTTSIART